MKETERIPKDNSQVRKSKIVIPSTGTGRLEEVRNAISEIFGGARGQVLLSISFGWFLGLGIRLTAPALIPYIRQDFGIDLSMAGILLSTLWVTYALFQLPGGVLGDRIGERSILVGSSILGVGAVTALGFAGTVPILSLGFVLLGVATGIYATTRFTSIVDLYPERAATATGISSSAGNLGTVLLPAGAGMIAAALSWRLGFGIIAPLFGIAAISLWLTLPARTSGDDSAVDEFSVAVVRRIARGVTNPRVLVFTAAMFFMSFLYQGFTSFYPTYLVAMKDIPEPTAALIYSAFFATGIFIQPVGGAFADSLGERPTLVVLALVSALGLGLLVVVEGFWSLIAINLLLSAQLGFWPVAQAGIISAIPTEMQGTGFGFVRTSYLVLSAPASTIVGSLGNRGLMNEAFLLLAACALGCALLVLFFLRE